MKTILFFKKTFWITLLINMFLAGGVTTAIAHEQHPNILIDAEEIIAIKAKIIISEEGEVTGEEPWKSAYKKMIEQAEAALKLPMMSVTFGGKNSGDENCANIRIFCNGRFYDDDRDSYDSDNGSWPIGAGVRDLGMAYAFTGKSKYAIHLIKLVKVWAIDSTTGMLPQFSNNQSRISLMPSMSGLIYGVDLTWNYPGWEQADKDAFKNWVLTFGRNAVYAFGQAEKNAADNNFENWRNAFLSVAGAFTGDQALLDTAYRNFRKAITWQVHCTGRMNQEYGRTEGWAGRGYSLFAIHAMTITAEAARHQGVDLYNYATEVQYQDWSQNQQNSNCGSSRGLKTALDYHAPFLSGTKPWPSSIIPGTPLNASHGMGIYELAYSVWEETQYIDVVNEWGRPLGTNNWPLGIATLTHANQFDLTLEPTAPDIMTQPGDITVTAGEDASFSVVATGSGPLSYQWFRDGSAIPDASNTDYTLTAVSSSDNGSVYTCEVSNSLGTVSSSGAVLTVLSDTIAPTLVSVFAASDSRVDILFNEPVSVSSAEDSTNYQVDMAIAVTSAKLSDGGHTVSLAVSQLTEDTTYTVLVSNIQDRAQNPNTIAALSSMTFTYRAADGFDDDNADGWTPLTPARWSVVMDEGDMAYYLNTSNFNNLEVGRLGEYSLLSTDFGDFTFTAQAKLGDDVANSALADYAVVFGFQDKNNYYYAIFNNTQSATQLFKVVDGSRTELATAETDWLSDNLYHSVEVSRIGSEIKVSFDGNLIMNASDSTFGVGQVGVGSYNDAAYFDDVSVMGVISDTPDNIAPVITLTGDNPQAITVGSVYLELGATAMDNKDGEISATIIINISAVDTTTVGSYNVTYNVSDAADNPAIEVTRMVNVTAAVSDDNEAPVITLLGSNPITTTEGSTYTDSGATAMDNIDGNLTTSIQTVNPVDTTNPGIYRVTYNVSDAKGNTATQVTRTVNVIAAATDNPDDSDGGGGALGGWALLILMLVVLLPSRSRIGE